MVFICALFIVPFVFVVFLLVCLASLFVLISSFTTFTAYRHMYTHVRVKHGNKHYSNKRVDFVRTRIYNLEPMEGEQLLSSPTEKHSWITKDQLFFRKRCFILSVEWCQILTETVDGVLLQVVILLSPEQWSSLMSPTAAALQVTQGGAAQASPLLTVSSTFQRANFAGGTKESCFREWEWSFVPNFPQSTIIIFMLLGSFNLI